MKSMATLVAVAGAALAANMSSALSQQVCSKAYLACVNACVERPRAAQDSCMSGCQTQNDRCSDEIYGGRHETDQALQPTEDKPAKRTASPHPHKAASTPPKLNAATRKAQGAFRPGDLPPEWDQPEQSVDKHSNE